MSDRRAQKLAEEALTISPESREDFLQKACKGDEALLKRAQEFIIELDPANFSLDPNATVDVDMPHSKLDEAQAQPAGKKLPQNSIDPNATVDLVSDVVSDVGDSDPSIELVADPNATADIQADPRVTVDLDSVASDPNATVDLPTDPKGDSHAAADPNATVDINSIENDPNATADLLEPGHRAEPISPARVHPKGQESASAQSGDTIGRYKLKSVLGEGGFGAVWLAEQQEPVKRDVALKIIKLGMDTREVIARFDAERQALALMDSPNIAKVFDAGATATGRPYFVMEHVSGVPIVEFCDNAKMGLVERLEIFRVVCAAIQHAHQKGIIHRDIKPSNVLVSLLDGKAVPKVIDFGIAKATSTELSQMTFMTEAGAVIGTPMYMSPEQAEMTGVDIDTRSDVYSLGVLLYELLVGATPYTMEELRAAGVMEMLRILREEEPRKPSTRLSSLGDTVGEIAHSRQSDTKSLKLALTGDLDWIIMRCLEKDRARRYDTPVGIAEDIKRYLQHEPVSAGPPSLAYKMKKFVRRNYIGVSAASIVVIALVLGIVATSMALSYAIEQRDLADVSAKAERSAKNDAKKQAKRAEESAKLASLRAEETAKQTVIANKAAKLAEKRAEETAAQTAIAQEAERQAKAREAETELIATFESERLKSLKLRDLGITIKAMLLADAKVNLEQRNLKPALLDASLAKLAESLESVNFTNVASQSMLKSLFEGYLEKVNEKFAGQPLIKARLLDSSGKTLLNLGYHDAALRPLEETIAIYKEQLGESDLKTLKAIGSYAVVKNDLGLVEESEKLHHESIDGLIALLGPEHPDVLSQTNFLGMVVVQRDPVAAENLFRKNLEIRRRVLGEHYDTYVSLHNLAFALSNKKAETQAERSSNLKEAEELMLETLKGFETVEDGGVYVCSAQSSLGGILSEQGRLDGALVHSRAAVSEWEEHYGRNHSYTLGAYTSLGQLLLKMLRHEEAAAPLRLVNQVAERFPAGGRTFALTAKWYLTKALDASGGYEEAEKMAREEQAGRVPYLGEKHQEVIIRYLIIGNLVRKQGRFMEAYELNNKGVRLFGEVKGEDHFYTSMARNQAARCLIGAGNYEQAELDLSLFLGPRLGKQEMKYHYCQRAKFLFALSQVGQGKELDKARESLEECFKNMKSMSFGPSGPRVWLGVTEDYDIAVDVFSEMNHQEDVKLWKQRSEELRKRYYVKAQ